MSLRPDICAFSLATAKAALAGRLPRVEVEGDDEIDEVIELVRASQELVSTDSNTYAVGAFEALAVKFPAFTDRGHPFAVFLTGRPLCGRRFDTTWSYYGWLDRAEVAQLRSDVEALLDDLPPAPPPTADAQRALGERRMAARDRLRAECAALDPEGVPAFLDRVIASEDLSERMIVDLGTTALRIVGSRVGDPAWRAFVGRVTAAGNAWIVAAPTDRRFVTDLVGWLDFIARIDRDLWFDAT